ncbi:MAG: peptidoglycan DD-metalloendopeptidase family protein, partial [Zhenhengia sp.]
IGEVIKLEVPDPILSISTTEQATFKELIPAEIEYVEFSDLYKDETKVYQEGYDGVKEITVDVHKVNGKEVSRDLITEKVLKEPKTKVIAFGTKEKPKPTSTSTNKKPSSSVSSSHSGMFMHPLNGGGTLTSNYGSRWGSFHRGLDIAASAGTPIYAAASGTVTYSGYNNGGFGKLIIIDHNNGYQTYYAHCSSLYVQVGQKVSKGQNIAGVGSTGNSTGNHVHFEIRSNGTPINPYNYVY